MMNKHISSLLTFVLFVLLAASCGNKNKPAEVVEDDQLPVFVFNQNDSLNIQALADEYLAHVNADDFEGAADMLYKVYDGAILPISDTDRQGYLQAMKMLPHFGFVQQELLLFSDRDNELRIAIKVTEDANLSSGEGIVRFVLNPVQEDGKWYLTLRNEHAEGVGLYH